MSQRKRASNSKRTSGVILTPFGEIAEDLLTPAGREAFERLAKEIEIRHSMAGEHINEPRPFAWEFDERYGTESATQAVTMLREIIDHAEQELHRRGVVSGSIASGSFSTPDITHLPWAEREAIGDIFLAAVCSWKAIKNIESETDAERRRQRADDLMSGLRIGELAQRMQAWGKDRTFRAGRRSARGSQSGGGARRAKSLQTGAAKAAIEFRDRRRLPEWRGRLKELAESLARENGIKPETLRTQIKRDRKRDRSRP